MKQAEIEELRRKFAATGEASWDDFRRLLVGAIGEDVAFMQNWRVGPTKVPSGEFAVLLTPMDGTAKIDGSDGLIRGCHFESQIAPPHEFQPSIISGHGNFGASGVTFDAGMQKTEFGGES